MMNEKVCSKATPTLVDTGTIFAETRVCSNCGAPIERVGRGPARSIKAARAWVHSDRAKHDTLAHIAAGGFGVKVTDCPGCDPVQEDKQQ